MPMKRNWMGLYTTYSTAASQALYGRHLLVSKFDRLSKHGCFFKKIKEPTIANAKQNLLQN